MAVKTRLRIFTADDVAAHTTRNDCWITRSGKVYDVTPFLADHPGGDDLILKHAGKDVNDAMADPIEHEHSDAAYDMLSEYMVGKIGTNVVTVSEDWVATDDFHPDETLPEDDFAKCEFLDLTKPLLRQIWESNFSKAFYLQQVHQPRHVTKTARLFGPAILEMQTRTEWYVVPTFWLPITAYIFLCSATKFSGIETSSVSDVFTSIASISLAALAKTGICFLIGNLVWTILEYTLHRFLFHLDYYLPDRPEFLVLHFLLHGIHHYLPMDRLRLVMPITLFASLQYPFTTLAHAIFPNAVANGIIAGAFTFYVGYDVMHYALHHSRLPQYMREMKKYHLAHHYKNFELGFGVTSKIWDIVFNTVLPV